MGKPKDYKIDKQDSNLHDILYSAPDLFLDEFDVTWMELYRSESGSYKTSLTVLPTEGNDALDDGRVVYNFNHDSFRSDDFIKNHTGKHILFSGCSNTEGVGSPLETIWSKGVYNKLSKSNDLSGFFSLGKAGHGWQKIILNFMIYGEKYGFPDFFFVMLPNISRFWDWHPKEKRWYYVQSSPLKTQHLWGKHSEISSDPFFIHRKISPETHRKDFIDFCFGWKMFEKFCESKGVKMLWSSWDYPENANHEIFQKKSRTYINLNLEESVEFIDKVRPDGKFEIDDLERRDGHLGKLEHDYWMSKFLERINNDPSFELKVVL
jgi:hypothetical protein